MSQGISTVIYPVRDIARAKARFQALLGVEPYADQPYYVGFRAGDQEIGLDPHGHGSGMGGPVGYVEVDDIEGSLQQLLDGGAQAKQAITDVGAGKRIATVTDPDGNVIGLIQMP